MSGFGDVLGKTKAAPFPRMVDKVDPDDGKTIVTTQGQLEPKQFTGRHACPQCGLEVPLSVTKCPQDGTVIADTLGEGRKLVGNYEFLEFIGSGGMGVIYKARHPVLKRLVAVKMLHNHLMNETIVKRFQHEAQAVSSLSHANVIAVHDFGLSEHGQPYMVMDYVDGKPLSEVLRQGPLGLVPVINIAIQIAEGLQHAHEHGVLHRDLKPSNIMVTDADCDFPEAKIVDFGIAKIMETNSTRVTQTGELIGTPQYMSPEQCRGGELDARSDVYALGCVMFEAITGKPPFAGESMVSVIVDQISKPARSLGEVRPDIQFPIELEDLIAKMLAKEPVDRFQSMNAFLQEAIEVQKIVAQREKSKRSIWRYLKLNRDQRHLMLLSIAASFTLIALASSVLLSVKDVHEHAAKTAKPKLVEVKVLDRVAIFNAVAADDRELIKYYVASDRIDYAFIKRYLAKDIGLDYLDCRNGKVNDGDLLLITNQQSLASLKLQKTQITDSGLLHLKNLKWLKELHLDETNITAEGIKNLAELKSLVVLSLMGTHVGDAGLQNLNLLPRLQIVNLWSTPITDNSMRILSQNKMLVDLNLGNCKDIPDTSFGRLASMPKLLKLKLEGTSTKDSTVEHICKIKQLKEIDLTGTQVTLEGLKQLRKLPNLEYIEFGGAPVTREWISVLGKFPKLIKLGFPNSNIDDATLALIPQLMPSLENLNLENCKNVSDKGLASIKKCKRMFWTGVRGTQVTQQGVLDYRAHLPVAGATISY